MRFKNLDLIIIIVIVAINVAWTQVSNHFILVGILLALPLILFFPGYALTQTLFRRRSLEQKQDPVSNLTRPAELKIGHPIGRSDQIVLSLGLSMAIDVLVGFALNIFPIGLNGVSWIFSLGLITTLFAIIAVILRRKDTLKLTTRPRLRVTSVDFILFGLAIIMVTSAIWLALVRPFQPQPSFTQFWMLPANQSGKACVVSLGVQSFETGAETYRVVVAVNNAQANVWPSVVLDPQQKWVQQVSIKPDNTASATLFIEAHLYKADQPTAIYRDVHMTFSISSSNINGVVKQQCVLGT